MRFRALLAITAAGVALTKSAQASALRIYSYDPADGDTRHAAGAVTFEFNQHLIFTTVLRILATEGQASADLKPAKEEALGRGGLTALIGAGAPERDLYEVLPSGDGPAMVAAFCPGARRAWMAIGRLKVDRDLRVFVLGENPGGGARLCRTLAFSFHGEWRLPPGARFDERQLERPRFPR
ncbi:MAG: hypothetical protein M3T55_09475 [Pseudomonadota bacterium]|nr:hypothetical protein [Pseudomonadota bacterium]